MPIIKRKIVSERSNKTTKLRHPLLAHGRTTAMVYAFIKANPECGSRSVQHITSSRQPFTDLMEEGLIREVNGKRPFKYVAVPENESGSRRDKVLIKVKVFVNRYGEFSIKADMIGQKLTAHEDFPVQVAEKEFHIDIPSPDDPYAEREIVDVNERTDHGNPQEANPYIPKTLIIDGDFDILTP